MPRTKRTASALSILLGLCLPAAAAATTVVAARGVDPRVDYAGLVRFGPWDDRNYQLRQADLELLSAEEAEQREPVPAFYRVELRRQFPGLRRSGPAQYPRSALPKFRLRYGGYLIGGVLYREARRDPVTRTWTVRETDGEPIEAWLAGSAGSAGSEGPVGGEEYRVTSPSDAAESALAHHPLDDRRVVAGSNGPGGGQRMHYSTDGGASWTQVALPLGGTCCDPTVAWSSDGVHAYAATLGGADGVWVYRSANGGQSWNDLETLTPGDPRREFGVGTDKEYLHVDPFPGSPCVDHVYALWQQSGDNRFARSADRAHTWSAPISVSGPGEDGFGADLTSDRAGHLYYFWPAFDRRILVARSTACGAGFEAALLVTPTQASYEWPLPSIETRQAWNYVSADADRSAGAYSNSLYVAFADTTAPDTADPDLNHSVIRVAYSRNGGSAWTVTTPHPTGDSATVDRWNPWLRVGPDGVVHVVFYDTRHSLGRTGVDLYHARSIDGGATWGAPERLTTVTSSNILDGFEFGDYNGLDVSAGNLLGIFTDNRRETIGAGDSVDVYVAGTTTRIFLDDFELGSTVRWSSVAP